MVRRLTWTLRIIDAEDLSSTLALLPTVARMRDCSCLRQSAPVRPEILRVTSMRLLSYGDDSTDDRGQGFPKAPTSVSRSQTTPLFQSSWKYEMECLVTFKSLVKKAY